MTNFNFLRVYLYSFSARSISPILIGFYNQFKKIERPIRKAATRII